MTTTVIKKLDLFACSLQIMSDCYWEQQFMWMYRLLSLLLYAHRRLTCCRWRNNVQLYTRICFVNMDGWLFCSSFVHSYLLLQKWFAPIFSASAFFAHCARRKDEYKRFGSVEIFFFFCIIAKQFLTCSWMHECYSHIGTLNFRYSMHV